MLCHGNRVGHGLSFLLLTLISKILLATVIYYKVYWEPCQTFKLENFVKIVDDWKALTIFGKSSILHPWQGALNTPLNHIWFYFQFIWWMVLALDYVIIIKYLTVSGRKTEKKNKNVKLYQNFTSSFTESSMQKRVLKLVVVSSFLEGYYFLDLCDLGVSSAPHLLLSHFSSTWYKIPIQVIFPSPLDQMQNKFSGLFLIFRRIRMPYIVYAY